MRRTRPLLALLAVGLVVLSACSRGDDPDVSRDPVMDTTNNDPLDGVPTQVLVDSAEAISQEVAAERGLIRDTANPASTGDPGRDSVPGAPGYDPARSRAPSETAGTVAVPPRP